jgi:hypothetical protein
MVAKLPRRAILAAAVAMCIACRLGASVARAKQRTYRARILALLEFDTPVVDEFVAELARKGYAERIIFERRVQGFVAMSGLDRAAEELVKAKVDLIFANGGLPALTAKHATSLIPIARESDGQTACVHPCRSGDGRY